LREELRRLQEVEVKRIKAVATNEQVSVMKPMDEPRCKIRLDKE
jgi:hypothetical protein